MNDKTLAGIIILALSIGLFTQTVYMTSIPTYEQPSEGNPSYQFIKHSHYTNKHHGMVIFHGMADNRGACDEFREKAEQARDEGRTMFPGDYYCKEVK